MLKIEKVDQTNKQQIIEWLKSDIIRHFFAYYDIQYDQEHTAMHVIFDGDKPQGYILTYSTTEYPSIVLESQANTAEKLLNYTPENHFILHTIPKLSSIVRKRFPDSRQYIENWMLVRKGEAHFTKSKLVRKLSSENDAAQLASLLTSRRDRPQAKVQRYIDWISKLSTYGVFIDDKLISCASSYLKLPQIWLIGGVYTDPEHRDRGYATLVTSTITKEALENAESSALFVRSDNHPAIRAYEKIGYRKIGEKLWVDVGTGLKP
jgi:RimJ/RimL family protein N-acetyltransferase